MVAKMNSQKTDYNQGISQAINFSNQDLAIVTSFLRKRNVFHRKGLQRILFTIKIPGDWLFVDGVAGKIIQISSESRIFTENSDTGKVYKYKNFKILVKRPIIELKSESLFSVLQSALKMTRFVFKSSMSALTDLKSIGWIINILTVLIDMKDPYAVGFSRLFSILARIISIAMQAIGSYTAFSQAFNITDMALMLSIAGMPPKIVTKIDLFSKLTGKKFSDSGFLMSVVNEFLDIVLTVMEWVAERTPTEYARHFVSKLREQLAFVTTYKYVKEMTELVSTYHKNQQIILDVQYRLKAGDLYHKMKVHTPTYTFCKDPVNRSTCLLWNDFTSINVLVKNYSVSSRMEPVCIVFEGAAGTGKSTFMNKIVAALKHDNMSVYCHTVPSIDSGKDFYDDYMNQDVFVMDDVGQQGKSQWRSIINFVAPVKYPLECASAEKKNTKFFSSKLILCTTNSFMNLQGFTAKDCIGEPEALFRRCHVIHFSPRNSRTLLRYFKYDYVMEHRWKNVKIAPWENCKFDTTIEGDDKNQLKSVYKMIKELLEIQGTLNTTNELSTEELDFIIGEDEQFVDAAEVVSTPEFFNSRGLNMSDDVVQDNDAYFPTHGVGLRSEGLCSGVSHYAGIATSGVSELFNSVKDKLQEFKNADITDPKIAISVACISLVISIIVYQVFANNKNIDVDDDEAGVAETISDWKEIHAQKHDLFSESGTISTEDETNNTRRYFRFFEIFYYHEGVMKTEYCQGAVSGKYAFLPLHALGDDMTVNIFRDWDRYQAKHYEFNLVPCRIVKSWQHLDIAVVEFYNLPTVPFKNANMIFKRQSPKTFSNDLYFCNVYHRIRNIYGTNIKMTTDTFRVVNYRRELSFGPDAGLTYNISALGLCGSLIIDRMNGFVGMHIAGNGQEGFSIVPPADIREEIACIMLSSAEPNFDHRENYSQENFSGSRLKYEKAQLSMAMQRSNMVPTELHRVFNPTVDAVCEDFNVAPKEPANIKKYGSPTNTLRVCSKKSFSPIFPISKEEVNYAKECLSTMLIEFEDLTDQETAFGDGDLLSGLNKDSANGYGYKTKKSDYFDFENKIISDEFLQIVKEFKERVNKDVATWEDFVAKEALKDEMRPIGKDPRVFRVMPLHHIFLTKKYLGKLFVHVRKNMWNNGIAVGMNPYKDWAKLYDTLRKGKVFALDFGKWDGSCHSQIQDLVSDVVLQHYKGNERKVLEAILHSMVRGFTLVNDELMMTTHSLPSGAWITAFFNSLINRALTAITIFREMKGDGKVPKISDFYECIDFVLGDDKICSSPPKMEKYFNALTLKKTATILGMTATDCRKQEVTTAFHPLEEVSFLKRTFRVHPVLGLVGPLSIDTLLTTVQWFDTTKDYEVVMSGKAVVCQIEAYIHSKDMLQLFQRMLADRSWYREFSEERIKHTLTDSDALFEFIKDTLDKKY
ncbi:hypothetical protein 1 [Wenzhou picorna-like virus 41]|uniref:hypothetical protein 1 n=1 Tax=Wenzhou picorna-like virus 41 TaxID=1923628 RepID=UPI00090BC448|nr:hypothetical protein 1 [Wenzhou picorna-like virus 41]APG78514.1 hypothetical protein 1 [Wenzhou picorna-like virus 41]